MKEAGRILIFTGNGKGKSTAAFGAVLRAVGHGWKILIVQFIKSNKEIGELAACHHLPRVEIVQMGCGFVPPAGDPRFAKHQKAAEKALSYAKKAVDAGNYDLIVLDELCTAVSKKMVDTDDVLKLIADRKPSQHLILTGRGANSALLSIADTATEMRCLKHALQRGVRAQKGVEF